MLTRILVAIPSVVLGLLLLIQFIPYGHAHTNPPDTGEPNWDSPRTRELVVQACYDCHSNHTVYPWYSNIAPTSWLTQHDIDTARSYLNFTDHATDPARFFRPAVYERLRAVRAAVDPDELFRANHSIPPGAGPESQG